MTDDDLAPFGANPVSRRVGHMIHVTNREALDRVTALARMRSTDVSVERIRSRSRGRPAVWIVTAYARVVPSVDDPGTPGNGEAWGQRAPADIEGAVHGRFEIGD